jgi:hypothetical protein
LDVNSDIAAKVGQRHDGLDRGFPNQHDSHGLQPLRAARGRQQDPKLLAVLEIAVAATLAEQGGDCLDLVGGGT